MELVDGDLLFPRLPPPVLRRRRQQLRLGVIRGDFPRRVVEQQVLSQAPLRLRNRGEAFDLFAVDDRRIQARLGAVIQKNRVHHLACRGRQAEGDIGNAENGLGLRQRRFDQPHAFDRLHRPADIVLIARGAGKHQRVEENILQPEAIVFPQQARRTLGDGQLALAAEGLGLHRILVNAAHHQSGAVAPRQRHHVGEFLLAVLQVDGIDQALALAVGQRQLHRLGIGGVNHDRRLDLADQLLVKRRDVGDLVAVGALQADVGDLRAVADLAAGDLAGLLPLLGRDQVLEGARADDVGALADQQRPVGGLRLHRIDAGVKGAGAGRRRAARRMAGGQAGQGADMLRRGAATAADDVDPAAGGEALDLRREAFRRLQIAAVFIRQTGVGIAGNGAVRQLGERAQMVGHELRPGGAVQADGNDVGVGQADPQRFGVLPRQHGAHGLDGAADHHRHTAAGGQAEFLIQPLDGQQRRLDVARVLAGFDQQQVGAAQHQAAGLHVEDLAQLGERNSAGDGDGLGGGAHRTRHEARPPRLGKGVGGLPRQRRRLLVQLQRPLRQAVFGQHQRRGAEAVGFDDVGAGCEIGAVNLRNHIRPGGDQVFVAALVGGAAEILGSQLPLLDQRPHGAVQHQNALRQRRLQRLPRLRHAPARRLGLLPLAKTHAV